MILHALGIGALVFLFGFAATFLATASLSTYSECRDTIFRIGVVLTLFASAICILVYGL